MKLKELIIDDLTNGWGNYERIIFPIEFVFIIVISLSLGDSKAALISAICGIMYTILAGKGKISCYFWGLAGTLCYSYIAFKNHLYGNMALYTLYYLPMQFIGVINWSKHLKKDTYEIEKTSLNKKERLNYIISAIIFCIVCYLVLFKCHDTSPVFDSITSILSVFGLILTVKRCIEQWYVWIIVNGLSVLMWIDAYMSGSNCFATILMWLTYFAMSFYFLYTWKKELEDDTV